MISPGGCRGLGFGIDPGSGFRDSGSGFRRFRVPDLGFGTDQGKERERVVVEAEAVLIHRRQRLRLLRDTKGYEP